MTAQRSHASTAPETFTTFGDLLHYLRRLARLTQTDVAVAVGYSREQITRLEQNQRRPDPTIVHALFLPLFSDAAPAPLLERLLELARGARAAPTSGPALTRPPPTNLPAPLTSFVGRADALSSVCALVRQVRLVALIGAGGVGKTRLAIAAGQMLRSEFLDGVWMVELAGLRAPILVATTVAQSLGVPAGRNPEMAVLNALRDKHALLLLDNCEHLLVTTARLAETLLQAAPGLHILATSRESLGMLSATAWRVPSLSLPPQPENATPAELLESEAVQLFVARARAAQPSFALNAQNAQAVAQICRRLDGVPLALELAAMRLVALSPQQIAARLTERFALLTDGNRTALPRHQTLRALVDWSYELLSAPEQKLLQTVSIFAGGWTLEAAEQVSGDSQTLNHLLSLVAKSLVVADPLTDAVRYVMVETIQAYAHERLVQSSGLQHVQQRHLAWCRGLARSADYAHPDPQLPPWYRRLAAEQDNLRAALAWALRMEPSAAIELVAHLWYFWFWGGYWSEGAAWAAQALTVTTEPSVLRATALIGASNLAGRAGEYATAARWLLEGHRLADALQNQEAMAWARISQSIYAAEATTAERLLDEALDLARRCGNTWLEADAACLLGDLARSQRAFERAERCYLASQALFEQIGSAEMRPWPIGNRGRLLAERGEYARAATIFADCVAHCREAQNNVGVVDWLLQLARAALMSGRHEQARQALAEGMPIARAIGNAEALIDWFVIGAELAAERGAYAQAASLLGAADALLEQHHLLHRGMDVAAGAVYERSKELLRGQINASLFEQRIALGRAWSLVEGIAVLSAVIADT